jgi:hypothetical protein
MGEILLSHPLVILYLLYVVGLALVAFWPDTRRPRRRKGPELWGALGAQRRPCLGSRLTPPTTLREPRKEENL